MHDEEWLNLSREERACISCALEIGNKTQAWEYVFGPLPNHPKRGKTAASFWKRASIKAAFNELDGKRKSLTAIEVANAVSEDRYVTDAIDALDITADWVLKRAALLANFNIKKFIVVAPNGMAYYDFSTATDDDWYCIGEYTVDMISTGDDMVPVERVKLKGVDKLAALKLVGQCVQVQAFREVTEVHAKVQHVALSDEELGAELAKLGV